MYDTNAQAISDQLNATSAQFFSDETIASILSLVTPTDGTAIVADNLTVENNATISEANGTNIVFVNTSATTQTTVTVTADIPAIFFQGAGGVDATIGAAPNSTPTGNASAATVAGEALERVVVGTEGADTITIADGKNTQVVLGDKDTVVAGSGSTLVVAAEGSSTVIGNDKTVVQAVGAEADFTISTADGKATIVNATTGVTVELTDVDFVQLDGDDVLVFADNADQAAVANMYHAALGRNADASGLEFWFDRVDEGISLEAIAQGFLSSAEYTALGAQTDAQFVAELYENLLGRDADAAGTAFWTGQLTAGVSRADVLTDFAEASVTGDEVDVVGTVTIIDPTA